MISLIKKLSEINGVSGDETRVCDFIISQIKDSGAEYKIDNLGNLIVLKKGKFAPKNKVMLASHMDEVGFIINYIEDSGLLRFTAVGGVDPRVVLGRRVRIGDNSVLGVVGFTPIHLLKDDAKSKAVPIDELYIDIGAKDKAQAEEYVSLGDMATFESEFVKFGDGFIKGKALDDRAGCAIMIDMINSELLYDTYFTFNVQEEVGLRGATASAYSVSPDYAIVIETTTACDISGVAKDKEVCNLKAGPVISFMDRSTIYDRGLYKMAFDIAKENNIKIQPKRMVAGGNEAGIIHKSAGGVKTLAVSMPCRYLHSASCVLNEQDIKETSKLIFKLAEKMAEL